MNIVENIRDSNAHRQEQTALIDGNVELSYGELLEQVTELKLCLQNIGIAPGIRVAFRCEDGAAYIIGSLALLETGAAVVPVDMSLPDEEVKRLIERIDVDGILFETGALADADGDKALFSGNTGFMWRLRTANEPLSDIIRRLCPAFIRFSSGTTGASKGVALSHKTILERTEAANQALDISPDDQVLWVLSMSHHFVVSILLFLRKGATIVTGHRNFPTSIFETASDGRITLIYASPFHYHLLANDTTITPQALNRVRLAISTAMKLSTETAEAFAGKFGFYPAEAYGIIEIGLPCINLNPSLESCGSVGSVLPDYEVRIDNADEKGIGEVLVRGKGMFDAYMSPPRLRRDVLDNGWFRTGDLGYFDREENLRVVGRNKTVIICAGMKVFPEEVENVLDTHHEVKQSLVYGAEHPVYGQIPQALVVPACSGTDLKELAGRLRRYCYEHLPPYCAPKEFKTVTELPKTASGKLKRR